MTQSEESKNHMVDPAEAAAQSTGLALCLGELILLGVTTAEFVQNKATAGIIFAAGNFVIGIGAMVRSHRYNSWQPELESDVQPEAESAAVLEFRQLQTDRKS